MRDSGPAIAIGLKSAVIQPTHSGRAKQGGEDPSLRVASAHGIWRKTGSE